jgi:hypothetical protein
MSEWLSGVASVLRSLTFQNVAVLAAIVALVIPVFVIWKALSDPAVLDRFLSSYRVVRTSGGCVVRAAKERGGPEQWSISTGFAAGGTERWTVGVILEREPTEEQIVSHCATLNLIVDTFPHTVP